MTFPVYIGVDGWKVHPHLLFELLGYAAGGWLLIRSRRRVGDQLPVRTRWAIVAAAIAGGAVGSRVLFWLEQPAAVVDHWRTPLEWPVGKTIVGGLLGGLIGVELTKRRLGVSAPTGDLFAIPLAVGIAIGRIGCFLTGLDDHTYGNATTWWTGVDFGDGIRRHPTALYEVAFLVSLAIVLLLVRNRRRLPGTEFRVFMIGYLAFRLLVDFIKPEPVLALGLSTIQWACAAALMYYAVSRGGRLGYATA